MVLQRKWKNSKNLDHHGTFILPRVEVILELVNTLNFPINLQLVQKRGGECIGKEVFDDLIGRLVSEIVLESVNDALLVLQLDLE